MRRLSYAVLTLVAWLAGPAYAAESAGDKPAQNYIDLQTIGLPCVVNRRLVNYVFVEVRLMLARGVDASKVQAREPYLRDTLVRAATHTPFNPPADGVRLQDARLKAELMKDATAEVGPGKVIAVVLKSETPQRRTGVPGGA